MTQGRLFLIFAAILGLVLTKGVVANNNDNRKGSDQQAFVGLWEAVDIFDGSTQLLSITCSHRDSCDVRLNDTAFTLSCENEIGVGRGEGSIHGHVLSVDLTLCCLNSQGVCEVEGTQFNEFVLDRRNGTLTNLNDDPVPAPNVFHEISK
jgi:hypothetical protein